MSIHIASLDGDTLAVVVFANKITKAELLSVVDPQRLPKGGHFPSDRLTHLHRSADFSDIGAKELREFQALLRELSIAAKDATGKPVRSAHVVETPANELLVDLYAAMWDSESAVGPKIRKFAAVAEALEWLDRPDLVIPSPEDLFPDFG